MASGRKPGPECVYKDKQHIDDGTLCRQQSPQPGPINATPLLAQNWMSIWQGAVSGWSWSFGSSFNWFGHAESVLLSLLDWLPFKQSSPFSTALLKHYVERSGGMGNSDHSGLPAPKRIHESRWV